MHFSKAWMKSLSSVSFLLLGSSFIATSLRADSVVFSIGPDAPGDASGEIKTTGQSANSDGDVRTVGGGLALNVYSVSNPASNSAPGTCNPCQLTFNSGDLISYSTANNNFTWDFGTSGTSNLALSGSAFGKGNSNTKLVQGGTQKSDTTLTLANQGSGSYIGGDKGTLTMYFNIAADTLNATLLSNLGLSTAFAGQPLVAQLVLNFTSMGFGSGGGSITGEMNQGKMTSYGAAGDPYAVTGSLLITPSPEPLSLALVGSGLLAVGIFGRRRALKA